MVSWILCICFAIAFFVAVLRLVLTRHSMKEISEQFLELLNHETNQLITITSNDKEVRKLASEINLAIRELRNQRHKLSKGNLELNEAITNISHDLRTPTTAIVGYLDLLEKESLSSDGKKYVNILRNRANVLTKLTEELFQYSVIRSVEEEEITTIELNKLLQDTLLSFYNSFLEKGIEPEIDLCEEKVYIRADEISVTRVFHNVISNALKYSTGDFRVKMTLDGKVEFVNEASNLNTVLVGRLFERFYTIESHCNSTGLGLTIAKILMERMHTKIDAAYIDGKLHMTLLFSKL